MALKPKTAAQATAPATEAPATPATVTDTPTEQKPKRDKQPSFRWTGDRIVALVQARAAGNATAKSILRALADNPLFAPGEGEGALTEGKVRQRIAALIKLGVGMAGDGTNVLRLKRGPGGGGPRGPRATIDVVAINKLLGIE